MRVSSFRYPACNARAPYCHLWPARLLSIFSLYLTNDTIFERKKKPLLLHLVGYLYYWQMGFNSVFKGLTLVLWHVEKGQFQQDRQCTYNVTLQRVRVIFVRPGLS